MNLFKKYGRKRSYREWNVACPVCKKGDMMMCDNYIEQSYCCFTPYKILTNVLYVKLVPYGEEIIGEYQGGFQKGKPTLIRFFTMRQMLEICWEQNIDAHHLFIDMTLYGYR
jgi:hypothetical protein